MKWATEILKSVVFKKKHEIHACINLTPNSMKLHIKISKYDGNDKGKRNQIRRNGPPCRNSWQCRSNDGEIMDHVDLTVINLIQIFLP